MSSLGAKIDHPTYGEGVIFNQDGDFWRVYFKDHGEKEFNKEFEGYAIVEEGMEATNAALSDITTAVEQVFDEHIQRLEELLEPIPISLGDRWEGGLLILQPEDRFAVQGGAHQDLFHKVVMVRDGCASWSNKSMPTTNCPRRTKCICNNTSLGFMEA